jgi:hypothetical protein
MTAVSLALLGGWLLWQLGQRSDATGLLPETAMHHPPSAPAPPRQASPGEAARTERPAGAGIETVYVVDSEAAAGYLHTALSGAAVTPAANHVHLHRHTIVVLEPGRDAGALFTEQQTMLPTLAPPYPTLVDLRPPVGLPPAGPDGTFAIVPDSPTFLP